MSSWRAADDGELSNERPAAPRRRPCPPSALSAADLARPQLSCRARTLGQPPGGLARPTLPGSEARRTPPQPRRPLAPSELVKSNASPSLAGPAPPGRMSRRLVPSPALLAAPFRLRPTRPQTRSLSTPSSEVGSSSSSETLGKGERPSSYTFLPKPLYKARLALLARPLPLASPPPPDPSRLPQPSAQRSPSEPKPSMRTQPERRPRPPPTEPWAVDPAHRRPTLWGLYRDLLRAGARPGADVLRRWVRAQFREKRASGDVDVAAAYLRRGYEVRGSLVAARTLLFPCQQNADALALLPDAAARDAGGPGRVRARRLPPAGLLREAGAAVRDHGRLPARASPSPLHPVLSPARPRADRRRCPVRDAEEHGRADPWRQRDARHPDRPPDARDKVPPSVVPPPPPTPLAPVRALTPRALPARRADVPLQARCRG